MDTEALLQPKDGDSVSGENLEYDPVFTDMELAAQAGEEQQVGDDIIPASDPDYGEVRTKAIEVLEQSHDLRAAVYLAEAVLHLDGLEEFVTVTSYVRGCLEQFWDTCHPELDEDDDDDPTMRINAIRGFGNGSGVYRALYRVPLTDSRGFGRFSLRDIEVADGMVAPPADMETVPDMPSVNAAFQDTDDEKLAALHAATVQATEDLNAISAVFDEKTPGMGPDLGPIIKLIGFMKKRLAEKVGGVAAEDEAGAEDGGAEGEAAAAGGGGGGSAQPAPPGAINSQADVIAALERIIAYYKRAEPSSPVPVLLERAKGLVGAGFIDIIQDMAPGGMTNVEIISGARR